MLPAGGGGRWWDKSFVVFRLTVGVGVGFGEFDCAWLRNRFLRWYGGASVFRICFRWRLALRTATKEGGDRALLVYCISRHRAIGEQFEGDQVGID